MMNALSVALLVIITGAAASVHDLALLLSVGGGTFATAVSSVFPALMYRAAVMAKQPSSSTGNNNSNSSINTSSPPLDTQLATGLMVICAATGATGVVLALQNHFVHA